MVGLRFKVGAQFFQLKKSWLCCNELLAQKKLFLMETNESMASFAIKVSEQRYQVLAATCSPQFVTFSSVHSEFAFWPYFLIVYPRIQTNEVFLSSIKGVSFTNLLKIANNIRIFFCSRGLSANGCSTGYMARLPLAVVSLWLRIRVMLQLFLLL